MRDWRGRSPDPKPIGSVLGGFGAEVAPQSLLASVQMVWGEVVGERIAAVTDPVEEHEGMVTVSCSSAVWAQELEMMAPRITAGINDRLEGSTLEKLRFRAGV